MSLLYLCNASLRLTPPRSHKRASNNTLQNCVEWPIGEHIRQHRLMHQQRNSRCSIQSQTCVTANVLLGNILHLCITHCVTITNLRLSNILIGNTVDMLSVMPLEQWCLLTGRWHEMITEMLKDVHTVTDVLLLYVNVMSVVHADVLLTREAFKQLCVLSLIHIWRCRRSYACRSRWSPYH